MQPFDPPQLFYINPLPRSRTHSQSFEPRNPHSASLSLTHKVPFRENKIALGSLPAWKKNRPQNFSNLRRPAIIIADLCPADLNNTFMWSNKGHIYIQSRFFPPAQFIYTIKKNPRELYIYSRKRSFMRPRNIGRKVDGDCACVCVYTLSATEYNDHSQ